MLIGAILSAMVCGRICERGSFAPEWSGVDLYSVAVNSCWSPWPIPQCVVVALRQNGSKKQANVSVSVIFSST